MLLSTLAHQTVTLNITPDNFNPIYLEHSVEITTFMKILFGGSSSGKSVQLAMEAVLDVLKGHNYLICRKVQNTVRKSVFNEVRKAIIRLGVDKYFNINKSDLEITNTLNQKQILFVGLDDVEKVKSITPINGVITKIWVEEATEVGHDDIKQLRKRLRGRTQFTKQLILSFNPILKSHWIYQEYFRDFWREDKNFIANDHVSILKTTYKDNDFLTDDDKLQLENEKDRYWYEVYTLGNWGILGHVIYRNWKVQEFDSTPFDSYNNGIDWGFSNHPFAFIRMHYDKKKNNLYICKEICQTNLLNRESSQMVQEIIGDEMVMCDNEEPKSIDEFQQLGVNAFKTKKGKGSIKYGIKFCQGLNIIIHPSCTAFLNQIQTFQYREDKYGEATEKPVDKDDDLLDAMRYGLEWEILRKEEEVDLAKPTKATDFKKLDIFDPNIEKWEDEAGVVWHGNEPVIKGKDSGRVTGY